MLQGMIQVAWQALTRSVHMLVLLLTISLLSLGNSAAQVGKYYSTENGFSSSLINCIYQDSKGFIWVATEYGLNRFDGVQIVVYNHLSGDSTSLLNNYVRTIYEDKSGRLLVGTITGLMRYSWETNSFAAVNMVQGSSKVVTHVAGIAELDNGDLWITTSGLGLFSLKKGESVAHFEPSISLALSSNYLNAIYKDSKGNIWIGSEDKGLNCYNFNSKSITTFRAPHQISSDKISAVVEDSKGNLFVGTLTQGLNRYSSLNNKFTPVGKKDLLISSLMVNSRNQLLVGTDGQGLKLYNEHKGIMEDFALNAMPFNFSKGKVHAIMQDRDEGVWLGIFQKGVVYLPDKLSNFRYYGYKSLSNNIIGSSCVMSICRDSRGTLWVGTDNEGLYGIDEQQGRQVAHFYQSSSPQSAPNIIQRIFEDSDGNLWVSSFTKGLAKIDRRTGFCRYVAALEHEKVYYVAEDKHKRLLIGTYGSGLFIMDIRSGKLTHYESSKREDNDFKVDELFNDWINYILCDSDGLIWIGHYKGLTCFDPVKKTFLGYFGSNNLLPNSIVTAIYEDAQGYIWVGTTTQLYRLNKRTGNMQPYNISSSRVGDMVCGIAEDESGHLWISTFRGICKLNVATGEYTGYYAGDGLQGNEFTRGAVFKDERSGRLYFGGSNGVSSFLPSEIQPDTTHKPRIYLTGFYLLNHAVKQGDLSGKRPIVSTSVFDAEEFKLAHSDNTFTLLFSTLSYANPEQLVYLYKMEGVNDEWVSTYPGINRATFNNLPPGQYRFVVQADDHSDRSVVRTVSISIFPPWYQTWWAYSLYALLLALLGGAYTHFRLRLRYRKQQLKSKEHEQEINEAKLQFFINISHEIRTPMTLIINPLNRLLAGKGDSETHKTYQLMQRNARRILRLINQLMDIRKIDKGLMRISCRETDMVGFIDDLMRTFEYTAQQKNIRFTFAHPFDKLKAWVDLGNFDKVMLNVLSNAFKFTPEGGEVAVSLAVGSGDSRLPSKEYFEIRVVDSGVGVEANDVERIFERFYQATPKANLNFGTGVGLHLSRQLVELHHGVIYAERRADSEHGTAIVIRQPLGSAHLMPDELGHAEGDEEVMHNQGESYNQLVEQLLESDERLPYGKPKSKYRVLLAEDEEELRHYLHSELSVHFRVAECANGKEALELLLREQFDAVVSDVMMPQVDGITLVRRIKQNININHIPVVLLSAKTRDEDKVEGLSIGADAYIPKPFHTDILVQTISSLIANREILRNKFSGRQEYGEKIERMVLKSSDEQLMSRILKVVSDNLSNPKLSVETLASEVGMSRVHMHRKLKELTNQSARDFIRGIRLKQAALLLSGQKLSISEVAYATGFSTLSHFSTSFKDFYGMPPTEYIENLRPTEENIEVHPPPP